MIETEKKENKINESNNNIKNDSLENEAKNNSNDDFECSVISDVEGDIRVYLLFFIQVGIINGSKLPEKVKKLLCLDKKGNITNELKKILNAQQEEYKNKNKLFKEIENIKKQLDKLQIEKENLEKQLKVIQSKNENNTLSKEENKPNNNTNNLSTINNNIEKLNETLKQKKDQYICALNYLNNVETHNIDAVLKPLYEYTEDDLKEITNINITEVINQNWCQNNRQIIINGDLLSFRPFADLRSQIMGSNKEYKNNYQKGIILPNICKNTKIKSEGSGQIKVYENQDKGNEKYKAVRYIIGIYKKISEIFSKLNQDAEADLENNNIKDKKLKKFQLILGNHDITYYHDIIFDFNSDHPMGIENIEHTKEICDIIKSNYNIATNIKILSVNNKERLVFSHTIPASYIRDKDYDTVKAIEEYKSDENKLPFYEKDIPLYLPDQELEYYPYNETKQSFKDEKRKAMEEQKKNEIAKQNNMFPLFVQLDEQDTENINNELKDEIIDKEFRDMLFVSSRHENKHTTELNNYLKNNNLYYIFGHTNDLYDDNREISRTIKTKDESLRAFNVQYLPRYYSFLNIKKQNDKLLFEYRSLFDNDRTLNTIEDTSISTQIDDIEEGEKKSFKGKKEEDNYYNNNINNNENYDEQKKQQDGFWCFYKQDSCCSCRGCNCGESEKDLNANENDTQINFFFHNE